MGGLGVPKILEHFFGLFTSRLFKKAGRKNSVQKPTTFSEANKIKFYAVLSHFAKCHDLRIKKCYATAQNRRGGSANLGNARIKTAFFRKGFPQLNY